MRRLVLAVGLTVLVAAFPAGGLGGKGTSSTALYPDLQTVVPRHLRHPGLCGDNAPNR